MKCTIFSIRDRNGRHTKYAKGCNESAMARVRGRRLPYRRPPMLRLCTAMSLIRSVGQVCRIMRSSDSGCCARSSEDAEGADGARECTSGDDREGPREIRSGFRAGDLLGPSVWGHVGTAKPLQRLLSYSPGVCFDVLSVSLTIMVVTP